VVARRALYDELIGELADRGTSVLVTSHDLTGMETIASRVAILRDGRLVVDEDVEELKQRYRKLRRAAGGEPAAWAPFEVVTSSTRSWGEEVVVSNFDESRLDDFQARARVTGLEVGVLSLEEIFVVASQGTGTVAP
jgi:ABC-2 type transport system ATP-binding protein